jgi:hypothetical protein
MVKSFKQLELKKKIISTTKNYPDGTMDLCISGTYSQGSSSPEKAPPIKS